MRVRHAAAAICHGADGLPLTVLSTNRRAIALPAARHGVQEEANAAGRPVGIGLHFGEKVMIDIAVKDLVKSFEIRITYWTTVL